MDMARHLVFRKGTDSHDYKFSVAVFEEYLHTTPAWRPRVLASSVFILKPSTAGDSPLLERSRQALAQLRA